MRPVPKVRRTPQRTCVGCGEVEGKRQLLRIVRTPEGGLCCDPGGKRNGRGAYVHRDARCFERAVSGRLLRALRAEGRAEDLPPLRAAFQAVLATPAPRGPLVHRAAAPLPDHLIARNRHGPTRTAPRPARRATDADGRDAPR